MYYSLQGKALYQEGGGGGEWGWDGPGDEVVRVFPGRQKTVTERAAEQSTVLLE